MRTGRRAALVIAVAIALAGGCGRTRTVSGELHPCDGASGSHLPFHVLDLGIGPSPRAPYVTGPAGREIVLDSTQWRRVWGRYAPSLPLPPVSFRDTVVLLVATRAYASGPRTVRILDVQRCPSGIVAVIVQAEHRNAPSDTGGRTIAAVALRHSLIGAAPVQFVELPDHWTR
jgi:hypothetical protein